MRTIQFLIMLIASLLFCTGGLWASDQIKIASIFSKTGEAVSRYEKMGIPEYFAIQYAVAEVNAKGGLLGKKVRILEYDNKSTALGSKAAAEKAVKDGVIAVIGATWSSHSMAMAPVLQKAGIPMITPFSTSPDVTRVGNYIFRVCFIDDFQGTVMANYAYSDLQVKRAVILTNTSETYSMTIARIFADHFSKTGGTVLWEGDYLGDTTDFMPVLKEAQRRHADAIFIPGKVRDAGYIIRQARGMGIKSLFLGSDSWDNTMYGYGGNAIEGSQYSNHWHPEDAGETSRRFVRTFQQRVGKTAELNAGIALTYDALMLLADAVKRARSLEPARIREALAVTRGFKGVTGEITFDGNRNPVNKAAVILRFEKGTSVYVKTVRP